MLKIRNFNDHIDFPKDMDPEAKNFISCCLRKIPHKRLNIHKLLQHKFLRPDKASKVERPGEEEEIKQVIKSICATSFLQPHSDQNLDLRDHESHHSTTNTVSPLSERSHKVMKYNSDISAQIKEFKEIQKRRKRNSMREIETQQTPFSEKKDSPRQFIFNAETNN
jgi:serine/threonine protein kinase